MNTHIRKIPMAISHRQISRRQIMIGAAGLSFAIASGRGAIAAEITSERGGKALTPWVSIAPDGTITIMSAATEMGQGSMTSLPLIIAEELDADWSKVKIVPAPVIEKIYGNPGFGGMMYTAKSGNADRVYPGRSYCTHANHPTGNTFWFRARLSSPPRREAAPPMNKAAVEEMIG